MASYDLVFYCCRGVCVCIRWASPQIIVIPLSSQLSIFFFYFFTCFMYDVKCERTAGLLCWMVVRGSNIFLIKCLSRNWVKLVSIYKPALLLYSVAGWFVYQYVCCIFNMLLHQCTSGWNSNSLPYFVGAFSDFPAQISKLHSLPCPATRETAGTRRSLLWKRSNLRSRRWPSTFQTTLPTWWVPSRLQQVQ